MLAAGQTRLVPFRAPDPGIAPGSYRLVLSVAGQAQRKLEFDAVPSVAAPSATPAVQEAVPSTSGRTVTQALQEVFATQEGPEAAMAGVAVIGDFFDQELGPSEIPAPDSAAAQEPSSSQVEPAPLLPPTPTVAPSTGTTTAPEELVVEGSGISLDGQRRESSDAPGVDAPGVTVSLGRGSLQLVTARELDQHKAPIVTPEVFSAADPAVHLALRAEGAEIPDLVRVSWHALDVEGMSEGTQLLDTQIVLRSGAWRSTALLPGDGGFWPGRYQARVRLENGEPLTAIEFEIGFDGDVAELLDADALPSGINLAHAALGGRVLSATSQAHDSIWHAEALIDGFGYGGEACKPSCGWASEDRRLPQELVFALREQRMARLKGVILDTQSCLGDFGCLQALPRMVEIWISRSSPDAGFELAAQRLVRPVTAKHYIPLPEIEARFVKLVIRSNYGSARRTQLAEVEILEADEVDSIVADLPIDLALPALGAGLVRYSSEHYRGKAARLLLGPADGGGWRSADASLPQEFTLSLRGDGEALIERVELDLRSGHDAATHPREIAIELSSAGPLQGFAEVARVQVPMGAERVAIPIGRMARFVKLRLLANHGGSYTSLGPLSLIEGRAPGYRSLIARPPERATPERSAHATDASAQTVFEVVPGATVQQATELALHERVQARFSPEQQRHVFGLTLPGQGSGVFTLDLAGQPFLRTGFRLLSADGGEVANFVPSQETGARQLLSWHLEAGRYLLEAEPIPTDIVLAWDISRSLVASMDVLREAVIGFIEHVGTNEALALIAFNNELHVLVGSFTNDKQILLNAVAGQFKADLATRLYDSIELGIGMLDDRSRPGVLVIMTDGVDMGSRLSAPQFWDVLTTNRTRIITLGLGGELQAFAPEVGASGGQVLRHLAWASGGRFIPIPTADDLVAVYGQIGAELMSGNAYTLLPGWTRAAGTLLVEMPADAGQLAEFATPSQISLVLDASGSMKKRIAGKTRMDTAKEVLADLIETLPANARVALRVYGHRIREGRPGDCRDTELIHPFAALDKPALIGRIRGIEALGTTPIAYSLAQTLDDFGDIAGEKTVILVTDGEEECGGDLVATVEHLKAQGLDVSLHIVGFALDDPAVNSLMRAAAEAGRGRYLTAADQGELKQAIAEMLAAAYQVQDSAGREVATGVVGQPLALAAGVYRVVIDRIDGERVTREVHIDEGRQTRVPIGADTSLQFRYPSATETMEN
ncbi:VWA domain-containing protein [Thiocapsa marina]|uniref:VWA domain-containing protein n=1 Tax=Thiocapsa marina TaxID=244573 RepID=UPI0013053AA5|nr:VWA domain-containing protein [Thiocapsa marina]